MGACSAVILVWDVGRSLVWFCGPTRRANQMRPSPPLRWAVPLAQLLKRCSRCPQPCTSRPVIRLSSCWITWGGLVARHRGAQSQLSSLMFLERKWRKHFLFWIFLSHSLAVISIALTRKGRMGMDFKVKIHVLVAPSCVMNITPKSSSKPLWI